MSLTIGSGDYDNVGVINAGIVNGVLDPQVGIYRDAENGPCEIYMVQETSIFNR